MSNNINNDEEFLKNHIASIENGGKGASKEKPQVTVQAANSRTTDLQYLTFDVKEFPCGVFYPTGTQFMIRSSQVKEIQAYSMVDDTNVYDIVNKMNDMLSHCVRVKYPDGSMGSYLDVRDPDRFYLIFTIRELTFQKGNNLTTEAKCSCGESHSIELIRQNFTFFTIDERIEPYYSQVERCFVFETMDGDVFKLAPPKIGIQRNFTDHIAKQYAEKKEPNMSFLKIMPFLIPERVSISDDGIIAKSKEYVEMGENAFQFLNDTVNMLTFGIKGVNKLCSCGLEVHSDNIFPNGASGVFVVHNAFDKFIKK